MWIITSIKTFLSMVDIKKSIKPVKPLILDRQMFYNYDLKIMSWLHYDAGLPMFPLKILRLNTSAYYHYRRPLFTICMSSWKHKVSAKSRLWDSELNQQGELKGGFLLGAVYCCFVWSPSVSAQLPVSPPSRTKLLIQNWDPPSPPPPWFFAVCRLKNPFHLLFILPRPPLQSHKLSLHYAEMLRCSCFPETRSCDVSCSSIAQQISTKTPGFFSTVG